jgi:nucleotide-binding universal stress UspA family protein
MYQHILVPTDGSEISQRAVKQAVSLTKALNARITFLTVVAPFHSLPDRSHMYSELPEDFRRSAMDYLYAETERALESATAVAAMEGVPNAAVQRESEHPFQAIIDFAQSNQVDLIVMASHGRSGVAALLIGSETLKVLTHSKVPVLVCR